MKKYMIITLIVITLITIGIILVSKRINEYFDIPEENSIAIMVYDYEFGDYVRQSVFPKGYFALSDQSYCENGSDLGIYDETTGTVTFDPKRSDKCYYYFDHYTPHTHIWDDGVVTKLPTFTEPGVRTYTCEECGEEWYEEIPVMVLPTLPDPVPGS